MDFTLKTEKCAMGVHRGILQEGGLLLFLFFSLSTEHTMPVCRDVVYFLSLIMVVHLEPKSTLRGAHESSRLCICRIKKQKGTQTTSASDFALYSCTQWWILVENLALFIIAQENANKNTSQAGRFRRKKRISRTDKRYYAELC